MRNSKTFFRLKSFLIYQLVSDLQIEPHFTELHSISYEKLVCQVDLHVVHFLCEI